MKVIDRYIFTEVIRPFLMVVVGVIVIMLSIRLVDDLQLIIVQKVPYPIVLRLILYQMPEHIIMSLPIGFMIATLLGLARLSKDYEIVALRSCGVSSKRIMVPIFLASIVISLGAFYVNDEIVPLSNQRSLAAKEEAERAQNKKTGNTGKLYFKGADSRFFSLQNVIKEEKRLEGILIFDSNPESEHRIISAQRGSWEGTKWLLEDGKVQRYQGNNFVEQENHFKQLEVETRIEVENYFAGEIKPKEMSTQELAHLIAVTKEGGQEPRVYELEYQAKFARPFSTFFTAIISAPIGLLFARGGYIGFAISIILTFLYFVAQTVGTGLGELGVLPVYVAAWLPNIIFGSLGGVLFWFVK